jgi:hypothetical protein
MTTQKTLKQRVRARMAETGERYTQARDAMLGAEPTDSQAVTDVEAIVLKVNQRSARVRLIGEDREVTFRSGDTWKLVPGHVAELRIKRRWHYRDHDYASGAATSARIDIPALGLAPLPVEDWGLMDCATLFEAYEDPDPYAPMWRRLTAQPRPAIRFHPIAWKGRAAYERDELEDCPVSDAADLAEMGDKKGARELLMEVLLDDLRCVDAHAHLGNLKFDRHPHDAIVHYEMGVRIGALSLPSEPELLVPWGPIYNRPYLRAMYGYALCVWRLERLDEAAAVFERILTLNPMDNQGARFCLFDLQKGLRWEEAIGRAELAPPR